MVSSGDAGEVSFRALGNKDITKPKLVLPEDGIVDAGFDRFVDQHWAELVEGEVLSRPFLVPRRLDFVDFRIRRESEDDSTYVFLMGVESALLRLFVKPIKVTYERKSRRLLRYSGISNMRDNQGDNFEVPSEFTSEPEPKSSIAESSQAFGQQAL